MKNLLFIIIIFCLIIFQSSLYPYLKIYNAFPNLILITVIILSILKGLKKDLIWIIIGGLLLDIFSFNNPIGTSILGLLFAGYLAYFFSQNIFKKTSIFSVVIISICGTLIYEIFVILILLIGGIDFQFGFIQIISQVIYNLIVLVPLFYLTKKFIRQ